MSDNDYQKPLQEQCEGCGLSLVTHPRCILCSILMGATHYEKINIVGGLHVCREHGATDLKDVYSLRDIDRTVRIEYNDLPELDLDDHMQRFTFETIPVGWATPSQISGMTGWNTHTIRVRIAKLGIPQKGWVVSPIGWKAGLYDVEQVIFLFTEQKKRSKRSGRPYVQA